MSDLPSSRRWACAAALLSLGAPAGLAWHDAEVVKEEGGRPRFLLTGTVLASANGLGAHDVHLSLSHDAGIASAIVVLEGPGS